MTMIVLLLLLLLATLVFGVDNDDQISHKLREMERKADALPASAKGVFECLKACGVDGRAAIIEQNDGVDEAERFIMAVRLLCFVLFCLFFLCLTLR